MIATLYKDFSDSSAIVEISSGVPIYQSLADINFEDKRVIVNGQEKTADYIPSVGDVIIIRTIPYEVVAKVFELAWYGVTFIAGGIYNWLTKGYREQIEELKNSLNSVKDSVVNLPNIKGASNSIATNKTQPYIIGEHLFTPYFLSTPYYDISGTDGADQYYIAVLEAGFAKQVIREIKCEETTIKTFSPSEIVPQEGVFTFDALSPFYDASSLIEIAQDGNAFTTSDFNKVVASEHPGKELKKADDADYEDLIFTLDRYAKNVSVCIMINGLRAYNDDGNHISRTIELVLSVSFNSGSSWSAFAVPTISRDTVNQLRFKYSRNFNYSEVDDITSPVLIKVSTPTTKSARTAYDQVYVEWIQSTIYDPDASALAAGFVDAKVLDDVEADLSTMIGLKIKATASNQDVLSKVNIITSGVARTWTGSAWGSTKVPTRNLAAWILEVLTSPTHSASQLDDSEIDLDSFGEFYEHCEINSITVDYVLFDGDEKRNILSVLCDIGNCALYRNIYDEMAIAVDAVKENAIAVLNTQNLLSFEVEKSFGRHTDGIRVSYISRDRGYDQDSYLVMRDGVTRGADSLIRDLTAPGRTTHDAIVKHARRLMAIETLRPRTIKARTGKEGIYYTPLAKVLVQHPALSNGLGSAEIKTVIVEGLYITSLELYEPVQYDSTDPNGFGVVIMAVAADYCTPIAAAYTADDDGLVYTINLVTPILAAAPTIPHSGDNLSYGYLNSGSFDTITSPMLIAESAPEDTGWLLTLVDYNEAIYDAGTIPDYTPNVTIRRTPLSVPYAPDPALDDVNANKYRIAELFQKNTSETTPPTFTADADDPGASWTEAVPSIVAGEYVWKLRSEWLGGVRQGLWEATRLTGEKGEQGLTGAAGADGSDGINARSVALTADVNAVSFDTAGNTPSPATINLTASAVNTSGMVYYEFFANDVSLGAPSTTATKAYSTSGKTFATMPTKFEVQIREGSGSNPILARDQMPITLIKAGSSAVKEVFPNTNISLPASAAGVVPSYTGSGGTLQVYEGNTLLTFHTTLAAGRFTVGTPAVSPTGKITVGARSGSGTTTCTIADHSAFDAATDSVIITYPITARRADGTDVSLSVVQTIGKSKFAASGWTPVLVNVTEIAPGEFRKTGGIDNTWDSSVYSTEGYSSAFCSAQARGLTSVANTMFGLNSDPSTIPGFTDIDFAWYTVNDLCIIYESGSQVPGTSSACSTDTTLSIEYDGAQIRYLKDGVLIRTTTSNGVKFFDSSFYNGGSTQGLKNVRFGPMGPKGTTGDDGLNGTRTASIELYKWAETTPTGTWPIGTSTYTWATGAFTAPATLNGWSIVPPAAIAGQTLYSVRAVYADSLTTATSDITWPASPTPSPVSAAGTNGTNGARTAVLEMYKWSASAPTTWPSGSSTYTWATGLFTAPATPNGWSISPGAAVAGQKLYATRVIFTDTDTSATDSVTWPSSGQTAYEISYAGTNGVDGRGISSTAVTYQVGTSGTTAPTGTWLSSPPATTVGQFLWTRTIITYTDATTSTSYSVSAHGATGAQGESSLGVGIKKGYSAFSTPNDGECYVHGFTTAGVAQDSDGYIYFDAAKLTVTKGMIDPGAGIDGFILLPVAGGVPVAGFYRISNATWYSVVAGTPTALTEANWLAIGEIVNTAAEVTESASLYPRAKRLSEVRLSLAASCLGIAASVTNGSGAVSIHQVTSGPYAFTASGVSRRARPGDCVFSRGGTATTGIGDTVKALRVFDGYYWEAPRTEDYQKYRGLATQAICEAQNVYQLNGVAASTDFDAVFGAIFSNQVLAARVDALTAFIESIFATDITATGTISGGNLVGAVIKSADGTVKISPNVAGTYDGILASEGDVDSPVNGDAAIGLLPSSYPELAFMQRASGAWVKKHRMLLGQFPFGDSLLFLDGTGETAVQISANGSLNALKGLGSTYGFSPKWINTTSKTEDEIFNLLESLGWWPSVGGIYSRVAIAYDFSTSRSFSVGLYKWSTTEYRLSNNTDNWGVTSGDSAAFPFAIAVL